MQDSQINWVAVLELSPEKFEKWETEEKYFGKGDEERKSKQQTAKENE